MHPLAAFCLAVLSGGSFPSRKGEMVLFGAGKLRGNLEGLFGALCHWPLVNFTCLAWMSLSPGRDSCLVPLGVVGQQPEVENRVSLRGKGCRVE